MNLTVNDWNNRFLHQARWTQHVRRYIYNRIGIHQFNNIIEIGCGTGAILNDFREYQEKKIHGLDISESFIQVAQQNNTFTQFTVGDAKALPLKDNHFDIALCHYFLLWVDDPISILHEMKRIVNTNGYLLILAEPDYGGRIDYPDDLEILGEIQTKSLIIQGADPFIGRKLGSLLHLSDLSLVEMGILGGQWFGQQDIGAENSEWQMLIYDLSILGNYESEHHIRNSELDQLKDIHARAQVDRTRVLFVPTFYAVGQVKK